MCCVYPLCYPLCTPSLFRSSHCAPPHIFSDYSPPLALSPAPDRSVVWFGFPLLLPPLTLVLPSRHRVLHFERVMAAHPIYMKSFYMCLISPPYVPPYVIPPMLCSCTPYRASFPPMHPRCISPCPVAYLSLHPHMTPLMRPLHPLVCPALSTDPLSLNLGKWSTLPMDAQTMSCLCAPVSVPVPCPCASMPF